METIATIAMWVYQTSIDQFQSLLRTTSQPGNRLFWLYLATSVFFAFGVFLRRRNKLDASPIGLFSFLRFLFPKSVWSHPSAWLDLRFFIIHQFTGKLVYAGLITVVMGAVFWFITGGDSLADVFKASTLPSAGDFFASIIFMLAFFVVTDFTAFFLHYLQHKVPFLWEFHKVHHSPEVMHPLSNFREHPFDNVGYAIGIGAASGLVLGASKALWGYLPNMPTVFGLPLLAFLFNVGGYHLRHSHIWLRWPGRWSMVFPSPAHHHVHHSQHPDHLDKNFAFMFPVWDVLFRTYHMPEDNKDVKFGIYGVEESEYTSIWKIYFLPLSKVYHKLKAGERLTISEEPRQDEK